MQKFPGFRNPDSFTWGDRPLVGFYYQTIFFAPVIVKQIGKNLDLNLVMVNKVC